MVCRSGSRSRHEYADERTFVQTTQRGQRRPRDPQERGRGLRINSVELILGRREAAGRDDAGLVADLASLTNEL